MAGNVSTETPYFLGSGNYYLDISFNVNWNRGIFITEIPETNNNNVLSSCPRKLHRVHYLKNKHNYVYNLSKI